MLSDKPNCIKAIMLLEVWKCRRLFLGMNGVTDRLLSAWVVFLLLSGTIGEGTSPVGIVAAVFNSFASSDWRKSRFSLRKDIDESLWSQFESEYSYVFLDNSGYFNIAGALEVQTIEDLRCLASDSLKKLNYFNEFDELFVQEHPFSLSFDYYLKFYVKLSELRKMVRVLSVKEYTDSCGHYFAAFLKQSSKLLDKAWSGRVSSFEFWSGSVTPKNEWPINEEPSSLQEELVFTIGTRVFTTWDNVLSRGPPAKSEGAVQFRKFWGETCELRKFADNAICESIIWRSEGSSETVLSMIARHILKRHLKLDMDSLFDCMNPSGFDLPGTISRYEHISQTFQKLSKELRLVKDLPLMITGVQPYSSFLRKTSPFAPPATDDVMKPQDCSVDGVIAFPRLRWSPSYLPSVDVLLTMEQSGKWGEDLPTICRLKAAFYIALAKLLSKKSNARFIPFIDALLVNMDSVLFRIIISYPKEVHIIKKIAGGHSGVLKETAESRRKERELIMRPQLASHLFSVSQQHPAFSMAVRIVKRWLSVHMLSGFIDDTIVETIVASVFIRPLMPATPRNPLIAFLHFLILISTHNWLVKPLCVDFNNDWKDSDLNVLEEEFLKMRPVLPAMVVCTAVDRSGARFTREEPQPVILKRLIAVASMTAEFFNRHLTSEESYNINDALSVEPMKFDAVIQLHGRHLVYRNQTRSGKEADALPVFDYDPILFFVERLRDDYGNVALFFYDKYGGDTIGVVWRPSAKENRPLNVSSCLNRMKTAEGDLTLNIPAIFEDFHIIGHGLVRSVKQCVLSE
ncbi:hypothetical protein AB6A40_003291 [Gnathostoma spinigerum]|uniref:Nucleolar protein 6 n=1 Tax=Gnathostoma spinigerum TaxID=75299 RepID=A0ABD6EJ51_9BILA